jgi:hypothetical protein
MVQLRLQESNIGKEVKSLGDSSQKKKKLALGVGPTGSNFLFREEIMRWE